MTIKRTNDAPLFEYVGPDEDWEKLNLPKKPRVGKHDCAFRLDEARQEIIREAHRLGDIGDAVGEARLKDISSKIRFIITDWVNIEYDAVQEIAKLRQIVANEYPEDEFTKDALLNHEVMSGEIKSDIEFPDGEFDNGNHWKGE